MISDNYRGITFEVIGHRNITHTVLINEASLSLPELIETRDGYLFTKKNAIAMELMDFIRLVSRTTAITFDDALEPDVEAFKIWWEATAQSTDLPARFQGYMHALTDDIKTAWMGAVEKAEAENRRPLAPEGLRGDGSAPDATPLADDSGKPPSKASGSKSRGK